MYLIFLTISLFFCHFLADFTHLSTPKMLSAKKFGKPLLPILKHATTHGTLMLFALLVFGIKDITILVTLFIFQVSSHFTIDTLKGKVNKYFPKYQNPENVDYWILFGFDQFLHTIVIITMITYVFINI